MNVELDTLIVLDYRTFYALLKAVEQGKDVDELIDELLNLDVEEDATPEP